MSKFLSVNGGRKLKEMHWLIPFFGSPSLVGTGPIRLLHVSQLSQRTDAQLPSAKISLEPHSDFPN